MKIWSHWSWGLSIFHLHIFHFPVLSFLLPPPFPTLDLLLYIEVGADSLCFQVPKFRPHLGQPAGTFSRCGEEVDSTEHTLVSSAIRRHRAAHPPDSYTAGRGQGLPGHTTRGVRARPRSIPPTPGAAHRSYAGMHLPVRCEGYSHSRGSPPLALGFLRLRRSGSETRVRVQESRWLQKGGWGLGEGEWRWEEQAGGGDEVGVKLPRCSEGVSLFFHCLFSVFSESIACFHFHFGIDSVDIFRPSFLSFPSSAY